MYELWELVLSVVQETLCTFIFGGGSGLLVMLTKKRKEEGESFSKCV